MVLVTGDGATGHVIAGGGMMMVVDGRVGLLHVTLTNAAVTGPMAARQERPQRLDSTACERRANRDSSST